jgi:hypothetical protein
MLDMLIKAFTQGDVAGYKSSLLHSSFWSQHNTKMFGEDKLTSVPLTWLMSAGRCQVLQSLVVQQANTSVIHLKLKTQDYDLPINYTYWLHNNGKAIKSVYAIVDTLQLSIAKNATVDEITLSLPEPDPLIIPDYDQQDNLQGEFAIPSSIISELCSLSVLLDSWWSIWSNSQLSIIDDVYTEKSDISLPGSFQQKSRSDIFEFVLSIKSKLTRVFCQLEDVVIEGNDAAIKWFIDADELGQKVRLPLITILKTNGKHITSEITTCDILAFNKRHYHSKLFKKNLT